MNDAFKLHRTDDPATSVEAAYSMFPWLTDLQKMVIDYAIQRGTLGFTDHDLCDYYDNHGSTFRSRRSELAHHGVIVHSGATQRLESGRNAVVWVYYKYHQPLVPEDDGQPDEAQEWADFDPEC
jgi:hypothetical protein